MTAESADASGGGDSVAKNEETKQSEDRNETKTSTNDNKELKTDEQVVQKSNSPVLQLDTLDTLDSYLEKKTVLIDDDDNNKNENKAKDVECDVKEEEQQVKTANEVKNDANDREIIDVEKSVAVNDVNKNQNQNQNENLVVKSNNDNVDVKMKDKSCKDSNSNSKCVWVSNVTRNCKACDLKELLMKFGKVTTAKILTDGKLFYGYAIMEKSEDVAKTIEGLNGTYFEAKKIILSSKVPESIKESSNKKETPAPSETESQSGRSTKSRRKPTPTLQNKSPNSRRTRSDLVREMEIIKRRMMEDEWRREERRREERAREKERDARRRMEMEYKLREARKKLEMERVAMEREKIALIKLQKLVADEERNKIKREKDSLKKEYKSLEAGLKRRKEHVYEHDRDRDRDRDRGRDRDREKIPRMEIEPQRRNTNIRKHSSMINGSSTLTSNSAWRYDDKRLSSKSPPPPKISSSSSSSHHMNKYMNKFTTSGGNNYHHNYGMKDDGVYCVAPPPPPKLSHEPQYHNNDYRKSGCYSIDNNNRRETSRIVERRDERLKNTNTNNNNNNLSARFHHQNDYDRSVRQKYPSTIGGFPNGKPDFMDSSKHCSSKPDVRSSYSGVGGGGGEKNSWGKSPGSCSYGGGGDSYCKNDNLGPRYNNNNNSNQFSQHSTSFGIQHGNDYYQDDNRFEFHGRKY